MVECIELERFYAHLTESPYAFTAKKTMIPYKFLKNKNIEVNKWGYVIREDEEIERIEENYYNWRNEILTKLKMIKEPRGLES